MDSWVGGGIHDQNRMREENVRRKQGQRKGTNRLLHQPALLLKSSLTVLTPRATSGSSCSPSSLSDLSQPSSIGNAISTPTSSSLGSPVGNVGVERASLADIGSGTGAGGGGGGRTGTVRTVAQKVGGLCLMAAEGSDSATGGGGGRSSEVDMGCEIRAVRKYAWMSM